MDAINCYIFNCKGDNFCVEESLICFFLKPSLKIDNVQSESDGWLYPEDDQVKNNELEHARFAFSM